MDPLKTVRQFLASSESILHVSGRLCHGKGPMLVLDSSFNPPTLAHLSMVKAALGRFPESSQVLLLLGTTNSDKPSQSAENYAQRLIMMQLFAKVVDRLHKNTDVEQCSSSTVISLSKHSRFIDKVQDVQTLAPGKGIVFLVGYDTLKRIFDPKYYDEHEFGPAIDRLMKSAQFCCVAREFNTTTSMPDVGSVAHQLDFAGSSPHMARYSDNITMIEPQSMSSSSQARKMALENDPNLLAEVVPDQIATYICDNKLYD